MKSLLDILENNQIPQENSDAELESLLEEIENTATVPGNSTLTMGNLNSILEMADNLYNTVAELETIDEETQVKIQSLTNTLKGLYEEFDNKYMITEVHFDIEDNLLEGTSLKEILNK